MIVDPAGVGPTVFFQPVPERKTGKNRLHLDVRGGGEGTPAERWARIQDAVAPMMALGAVSSASVGSLTRSRTSPSGPVTTADAQRLTG
ncbi:MAG TPA: VOC family protein [Mycobacteriales bacterium]|jgi:hypothetical protein|nr:VOC family protein [Mycobacteriales bacterium]